MALTREEVKQIADEVAGRMGNGPACFETGVDLTQIVNEVIRILEGMGKPTPDAIALIISAMGGAEVCGKDLSGVDETEIMKAYFTEDFRKLQDLLKRLQVILYVA